MLAASTNRTEWRSSDHKMKKACSPGESLGKRNIVPLWKHYLGPYPIRINGIMAVFPFSADLIRLTWQENQRAELRCPLEKLETLRHRVKRCFRRVSTYVLVILLAALYVGVSCDTIIEIHTDLPLISKESLVSVRAETEGTGQPLGTNCLILRFFTTTSFLMCFFFFFFFLF